MPVSAATCTVERRAPRRCSARLARATSAATFLTLACILHILLHMQAPERAVTRTIRRAGSRRTAVLFARVSANERPQVEAMGPRLRCIEALAQAAELSGGRVLRRQGDAVMALFASADAAAAAATRMHAYVETGGEQASELRVRIGLQSGPVTQDGHEVLGDTVDLALEFSRLAE